MDAGPSAARDRAAALLSGSRRRWLHSQCAAAAAAEAAPTIAEADRRLLVAAAWVHDIGYRHPRPPTGYHPVDGALLLTAEGWPSRLAALVAHHSEARFGASARGLLRELSEFDREVGPVADALVYADMTAGRDGRRMHLGQRLADARRRHTADAAELQAARTAREPYLLLAAARVDLRLLRHPGPHHLALPARTAPETADLVTRLADEHPRRDVRDLRAAVHAALSLLEPATNAAEVRRHARRLLAATSLDAPD